MRKKMGNTDILGILCDDSLNRFRERLGLNMSMSALVNVFFLVFMGGYVLLTIFVIHPALPNFTGNQIATDNIVFGVIAVLFVLFTAFFLKLNSAAAIIACHGPRDADLAPGLAIKILMRRAFGVLSLTVAKALMVIIIFGIFAILLFLNLGSLFINSIMATGLLIVLLLILMMFRLILPFAQAMQTIMKKFVAVHSK